MRSQEPSTEGLIQTRLQHFSKRPYARENDTPFFVADFTKVIQQHQRWTKALPHIQPFYAVKCNSDQKLLQLLAEMGVNFDCASLAEIEQILDLGVDPCRIIFAHTCKAPSALDFAARQGIRWATFDNADELHKIQKICPEMELVLRIYAQDPTARIPLGAKFGASVEATSTLLVTARRLGLKVVGVSFHVGSGAADPNAFVKAITRSKCIFEEGNALGFDMHLLDIGGGFDDNNFEIMVVPLCEVIAREFPGPMTLIAEPGRFYAHSFLTMICQVISRRTQTGIETKLPDMLYLNDGLYGCFSSLWTESDLYFPTLIVPAGSSPSQTSREWTPRRYSLWGPTCDSMDCISKGLVMDQEVKIGDWLRFSDMGAYTTSACSRFNGFPNDYTVIYP